MFSLVWCYIVLGNSLAQIASSPDTFKSSCDLIVSLILFNDRTTGVGVDFTRDTQYSV